MEKIRINVWICCLLALLALLAPVSRVNADNEETEPVYRPYHVPIFAEYREWPPESIAPAEKELLSQVICVLETTRGIIRIRVFPYNAPFHSANFVKLIQDGFYDGIIFHRVIEDFMSQGGDPDGTGSGGPGYTLPAEIGMPHVGGSIAAARTGDAVNPERRSSGSQFYMVHTDTSANYLDGNYSVFGQIIEGQDVNLSLSLNYSREGQLKHTETDYIIQAWVEVPAALN